jgi:hypothetical protein
VVEEEAIERAERIFAENGLWDIWGFASGFLSWLGIV